MKCPICNGKLVKKEVKYEVYGFNLGNFIANICSKCKEQWFDESITRKIENLERKKGLFGISKESKISYSGNSLIIRIPKRIVEFMKIKKETPVLVHPHGKNKIEIELQ